MSLLLSLLAFITFLFPVSSSDVVELTDANFWEKTKDGTWAIEIYATWCGHCQKLAPTWEEVATELKGRVNVAKIESSNEALIRSFKAKAYPTIKLIKEGFIYTHTGARDKQTLLNWILEDSKTDGEEMFVRQSFDKREDPASPNVYDLWWKQVSSLGTRSPEVAVMLVSVGFLLGMIIALIFFSYRLPTTTIPPSKAATQPARKKKAE
eukprot:TRINITY_DN3033_c0_g1_i12.p1 TRINITY_DN3033_c0_g1~~TRINITY_DN3033_c0_g1_i12.p1  ORF type:complete len:223 (+),score=40.46 TRINITY_DN3033_c0_g1_i12:43-669(+)